MAWYWIVIIVIAASAIVNPILYFITWELYKRKEWIQEKECFESDERFFDHESYWGKDDEGNTKQYLKKVQIAPVVPQIKDVWESVDAYWIWWFPVASSVTTLFYICSIIARPFEKSWKWLVRKIANIKV